MSGKRGQDPGENPWIRQQGAGDEPPARDDQLGPPSLRPPATAPKRRLLPLLLPIGAALLVLVLIGSGLVVLLGGGDPEAKPAETPPPTTAPPTTGQPTREPPTTGPPTTGSATPRSTYTPPANAIPVGAGVSLVPAAGWTVFAKETEGKQLIAPDPNGKARASFWVRQKSGLTAETYLLRIVEGEIENLVAQLGKLQRNLPCPRDVLVECAAITYTATGPSGVKLRGFVETYRRQDGLVTGLDFQSRADYAVKATADAQIMKKSVIDSM
jgi:hypothetical protein